MGTAHTGTSSRPVVGAIGIYSRALCFCSFRRILHAQGRLRAETGESQHASGESASEEKGLLGILQASIEEKNKQVGANALSFRTSG